MPALYEPNVVYDTSNAAYWENELWKEGTALSPVPADMVTGSCMTVRWSRTQFAGLADDFAEFTLYWSVQAAGVSNLSKLTDADAAVVENKMFTSWFSPIATMVSNDWRAEDALWRHWSADNPRDKQGRVKLSPPWRLQNLGWAGTGTAARLPDQVALTTTFRTASRQHWGRFYMGGITVSSLADYNQGQLPDLGCDTLASAMNSLLVDLADDARIINLWIWSNTYRGCCSVTELAVDSVFDVVRSRRAKQVRYRKVYPA